MYSQSFPKESLLAVDKTALPLEPGTFEEDEQKHTRDFYRLYLQKSLYAYDATLPSSPISRVKPCRLAGLFVLDACNYYTRLIPIQPGSLLFSRIEEEIPLQRSHLVLLYKRIHPAPEKRNPPVFNLHLIC